MRRLLTRAVAPALAGLALAASVAAPALAADEITIDHVQSEGDGTASVLVGVDGLPGDVDPTSVTVEVDGTPVEATAKQVEGDVIERTTMLVVDVSNSMAGAKLDSAVTAVDAFLAAAPDDVRIGMVAFAGRIERTVEPTKDHDHVASTLRSLSLSPGTKVYDASAAAIEAAGEDGARSLLVLSDGADTGSETSLDDLATTAEEAGVVLDVVALGQSGETLQVLAEATGGRIFPADPAVLRTVLTDQADALASQLLVTIQTPDGVEGDVPLEVSVESDGQTFTDAAFVSLAKTEAAEEPGTTSEPTVVVPQEPMLGRTGFLVGAGALGLGLAGVLAFALGGASRPNTTQRRLEAYFGQDGSGDGNRRAKQKTAQVSLRDAAVDATAKMVRGDFEDRLAMRLAGAGLSLKPAEWLLIHAAVAIGAAFAGLIVKGPVLMVLAGLIGAVLPPVWLKRKHGKRRAAFTAQLAETLTLMAGGLSAGLSLPQAIDTVVREGSEPMAGELRRALMEQRLGIPVEEALESVGQRMESEDFQWVVMAIRIQREVGGNLAELMNTVADTLREREYLRRQVRVLSAEGRFSGYVLIGLPVVLFCYMLLFKGEFVRPMYTTGMGFVLLGLACFMLAMGAFVMSRLVKIKV